jgi:glyoxylase I family protein
MPDFDLPPKNTASPFADVHGHHVAIRATSLEEAKDFYVGKLDFRVVAEWDYEDEKLAYLVPPGDDNLFVEILGGGDILPTEVRPYKDLGDSLKYAGYHHFCLDVQSVDDSLAALRERGVTIVAEPWLVPAISRKLAFICDPFGNLIELSELVD